MKPDRIVLPETRAALQQAYPRAFTHPPYLRLLEHVLWSTHHLDGKPGHVVLDQQVLAWAEGQSARVATGKYNGEPVLRAYLQEVHGLTIEEMGFKRGQARAFQPSGPAAVRRALYQELCASRLDRRRRGVSLVTGRPVVRTAERYVRQKEQWRAAQAQVLQATCPVGHPAHVLLTFLNTQPTRALRRLTQRHIDAAREAVRSVPELTEQQRGFNLRRLHDIEQDEVPLYEVVAEEAWPGLRPTTRAHRDLHPIARRTLYRACTRLVAPPLLLALAARLWKAPDLRAWLLEAMRHGWTPAERLFRASGLVATPQTLGYAFLLQEVLRSLLLGASPRTLTRYLSDGRGDFPGMGPAPARRLLASATVQTLLRARERRLSRLRAEGGVQLASGTWLPLEHAADGRGERQLLAAELSAAEQAFWAPAVTYLTTRPRGEVAVACWLPDDISLHLRDASKAETHLRHLYAAMTPAAQQLGFEHAALLIQRQSPW